MRSFPRTNVSVPYLHPVYLPLDAQHLLLVKVQAVLEEACYTFGHEKMADILQKKGWDCPESVELNEWTRVLRSQKTVFNADLINELPRAFDDMLDSLTELRHTVVHRNHKPRDVVRGFVTDAASFSKICENKSSSYELELLLLKF